MNKKEDTRYSIWAGMLKRCRNKRATNYKYYGGRGIKVCTRWETFTLFCLDMGERPAGTMLDRIDNKGNYEPSNCRWTTAQQQCRNRQSNHIITINGLTKTLAEWAEIKRIPSATIRSRLKLGISPENAVRAWGEPWQ